MSLPLGFHPAVCDEIDDAQRWYEQRRPGLGRDFLNEVERVFTAIAANPARFGFSDGDVREGLLTRFPFAIYYRVLPNRIRVLALYHTSRNPLGWKLRS